MTAVPEVARTGTAAPVCVLLPSAVRQILNGQDARRTLGSARSMMIAATVTGSRASTDCAGRRSSGRRLSIPPATANMKKKKKNV